MKPRLLDAFCGAGGATRGYQRAGFHVTGVDLAEQPNYVGDEFVLGDAVEFIREHGREFDAIHASPPCQSYARVTRWRGDSADHPDLLGPTRAALADAGRPWIIENVPEAPLRPDYLLCGSMFGLHIRRHRAFESSWGGYALVPGCQHHRDLLPFMHKGERAFADAMGCTWMSNREAREAIPPVFAEFIGGFLRAALGEAAA